MTADELGVIYDQSDSETIAAAAARGSRIAGCFIPHICECAVIQRVGGDMQDEVEVKARAPVPTRNTTADELADRL